jgi:hypothetical protein
MVKINPMNGPFNGPLDGRSNGRSSLVADEVTSHHPAVPRECAEQRALLARLEKRGGQRYRRYDLKPVGNRLMFVRDEIERMIDEAIAAAFGAEPEPDDRDGTFL